MRNLGGCAKVFKIRSIENKIDNMSAELRKEFRTEIREMNKILFQIANRPININNKISLTSNKLEEKIINIIDQIIENDRCDINIKTKLEKVKNDITTLPKNSKTKNRITKFFQEVGDSKSDIYKTIKGAGITKNIISDLINLGSKLRDLL